MPVMSDLFHTYIYLPLYNALIYLIHTVPFADVGLAVIALTILVKILLLPLAYKASVMQQKMKKIAPQIEEIKAQYKDDRQTQTLKIMELYKENNIRPLFSILVIFAQIPVILGLYWVFSKGGLPSINSELLYDFVKKTVTEPNMLFLGIIDMSRRSIILAVLVAITQFFATHKTMPKPEKKENPSIKDDIAHSMYFQMKFFLPVFMGFIAYSISAAVALYFIVSNLFTVVQDMVIKRLNK